MITPLFEFYVICAALFLILLVGLIATLKHSVGDSRDAKLFDFFISDCWQVKLRIIFFFLMICSILKFDVLTLFKRCLQYVILHFLRSDDSGDIVATGGRGDKSIFIYHSTTLGKLERKHKLHGHAGNRAISKLIILPLS